MKDKASISRLTNCCATDFIGEVFFDELKYMLGDDILENIVVFCRGMNQRVKSNDVLSLDTYSITVGSEQKEFIQLNLARNSIYHQLPELLFHPLVISSPGMSNKEIVDAIKANEKQDKELVRFFAPFDTFFFLDKYKILNRHLNLYSDKDAVVNLQRIIDSLLDCKIEFSDHEKFKLFRFILHSEIYKENLPLLEDLLLEVLELHVRLSYEEAELNSSSFSHVGLGHLGYDLGLDGQIHGEIDDIKAEILFSCEEIDYKSVDIMIQKVRCILEYFVLSSRQVKTSYSILTDFDFILGSMRLGYGTNI